MMFDGLKENENIVSELLHAIVTMNVNRARIAFEKGIDPCIKDVDHPIAWQWIRRHPEGSTLIQDAVLLSSERRMQGDGMEMIEMLIEKGCPIGGSNNDGYTALHNAALVNHAPAAKRLIEMGIPVDAQSIKGYTPLQTAMSYESHDVVALLLANDAKTGLINHRGEDAVAYASRMNNPRALLMVQSAQARRFALLALQEIDLTDKPSSSSSFAIHHRMPTPWQTPTPYDR